ncbi:MAG: alpha/beta fold hydrolase [Planctomycetota bacterium]|nr:alpha/beta fold hydrolase [Planctomycetota bacterium]
MNTALLLLLTLSLSPTSAPSAHANDTAQVSEPLPRRGTLGLSFSPLSKSQAEKHGLAAGEGLVAQAPAPGRTAEKIGIQAGDIVLKLNGEPVKSSTIGDVIRSTRSGTKLSFSIVRKEQPLTLEGALQEKARDPGTDDYEVIYSHVTHNGQRMRTILTKPKQPGPHPGFMFIQGFSPISYDYVLSTSTGDVATMDGPLLHAIAAAGFVTIRVEKPGVGDSEGGPFADLDYQGEIGIYKETLAQLKATPGVDLDNVFLFGHSMGASFGPMIAAESPVKGIAVYGAAARTWFEYLLDTIRYQGLVGGDSFENTDEKSRQGARIMAQVMLEGQSPAAVKEAHPELAPYVDAFFPGGLFNGKTLDFWRQLNEINFASYWSQLDCHVLAVKGASDFVVYEADHKLIADIVNRKHEGQGKFVIAPNSDHLFHAFATEQDSMRNFQRGTFSDSFTKILKDWMAEVMRS